MRKATRALGSAMVKLREKTDSTTPALLFTYTCATEVSRAAGWLGARVSHMNRLLGPYRTCQWHFKCLDKIGRVELVPTFSTIRLWHRTRRGSDILLTAVKTLFCSARERHAPEKFFVACRCISIGNFSAKQWLQRLLRAFSLAQQRCREMLWS